MAFGNHSRTVIPSNLRMRGDLKVAGHVEFATDFQGSVRARGEVHVLPGVTLEADIISESLRLDPTAQFKGQLQIGEARKPLSRVMRWWERLSQGPNKGDS